MTAAPSKIEHANRQTLGYADDARRGVCEMRRLEGSPAKAGGGLEAAGCPSDRSGLPNIDANAR